MDSNHTKKTIRIFALASFLNDLGSDIIYPVWPLFVTTFLHANMAVLGFVDGLGEAIVSLSQGLSGYLSDRIRKRKIFIWLGYLFGSFSRIGYAFSTCWQILIPFKILDRMGKIRSAPRDAMIADMSDKKNRGKNFGFLRSMDNLGAVCGILISVLLLKVLGYRKLFALAAIPSVIGALLILFSIQEKKEPATAIHKGFFLKAADPNYRLFLITSIVFALGSFSYSFLLIFAKESGFKVTFIPLLYLIFTLTAALFSLPFGRLSDSIGRKPVLILSLIFWVVVCISFIFVHTYSSIVITFIFYGLHKGAIEPVQKTLVSELAPVQFRAGTLGSFNMLTGLCALPASFIAGVLWDTFSIFTPFYFSLLLTSASIVMLLFVKEK